jgi:hypothetical protein
MALHALELAPQRLIASRARTAFGRASGRRVEVWTIAP